MIVGLSLAGAVVVWLVLLWITRRDSAVVERSPEVELGEAMRRLTVAYRDVQVALGRALVPAIIEANRAMERFLAQVSEAYADEVIREADDG